MNAKKNVKKAKPASAKEKKPAAKPVKKEAVKPAIGKAKTKTVSKKNHVVKVSKKPASKKEKQVLASFSPEYLVLMQKDPNWLHAFWEVNEARAQAPQSKMVLRLYDVSSDLTVRKQKRQREKFRDIEIPAEARSWYVQNKAASRTRAVLGYVNRFGVFLPVLESEPVSTFSFDGLTPSAENVFFNTSIGRAGIGGFGSSGTFSPNAASWLESLAGSSESFSSGSLSSHSLAAESAGRGKDFFLWVKTRLIVYGGTRPDAHLQVRGEDFPLNPDGTFSFDMDLPDSTQVIPVFATDKDGDFPTTIVPVVVKKTE
ncbi:MAG: DUF4912 domain-containing protein [Fibrobacter sp.]|jgi:hypothetical protein|nr:DUF4912 domain-containing protein [Fibrobacter sp.]